MTWKKEVKKEDIKNGKEHHLNKKRRVVGPYLDVSRRQASQPPLCSFCSHDRRINSQVVRERVVTVESKGHVP